MNYLKKSFSVAMPTDADWPFEATDTKSIRRRAEAQGLECGECGQHALPGSPHIDLRDEEAKRPRKRVCFGKVIAR